MGAILATTLAVPFPTYRFESVLDLDRLAASRLPFG
jgi:hypothetical protein